MLTFILGLILAGILFLAISLQKTYHHVPLRELKRQANQGDEISKLFYRVAAFDVSLDVFLWIIIGISAGGFFVFLGKHFPWPMALFGCIACIWFGFAWLPGSHITKPGFLVAKYLARPLAALLEWLHTPFVRLFDFVNRFRPVTVHTGLYTKEDFLEFVSLQRSQIDNRVSKKDLDRVAHTLLLSEKRIGDIMTPWKKVKKVATHDMVGPVLMDELHASGHTHFPVFQGSDQDDIIGTLNIADMLDAKAGGFVKDIMTKRVYFLHEDEKITDAFASIAQTKHPLFLVINSKENIIGVLSLSEVLTQMAGELPSSDFTAHDSKSAVAAKRKATPKPEAASAPAETDEPAELEESEKTETEDEK